MPVELKSPGGLWLLGLLVPLVLLYILKVRRQRLRVASTWLWAQAQRDLMAKSPFKRLIMQVPLVLQALALILLALALARPATRGGAIIGDHVAIIVDTSASMGAKTADGTTRMEAARAAAKNVIAALGPGADAMLVEAGSDANIASPLDRDARRLEAAVDRIREQDVEGHLGRAVAIAADRLRQLTGDKRIVVITDGALADPKALLGVTVPLDVVKVGTPVENTAVVRLDVRDGRDPVSKQPQVQAFALVAHYGTQPRDVFVTLRMRNVKEPLASRKVTLKPGERAPVVLTFEPAPADRGMGLIVEVSPPDALAADDRAFGRVPVGRRLPVVLAPGDGNPWVKRALSADPDVDLAGTTVAELPSAGVAPDALVVVDGACPAALPGGDVLILNPPPGRCRTAVVGKSLKTPQITSWADADARLRFLTLDGVQITEAHDIETEGPADALVRSREGTLVSDISIPGRTGTLVSFDVGESNWPLRASFVLFIRNIVELARTHRARGVTGPAQTGAPMRVRVPPGAEKVEVEGPDEKKSEVVARAGLAVVPEVARAGFYFVSWQGARPGSVLVPANLTSDLESDVREKELAKDDGPVHVAAAADVADAYTDWTWLLAALALLFVVFDVWWLTRKPLVRAPSAADTRPPLPTRRAA
ncbi:MAG: VWA domain-containing protein [Myxococcales bacterium]|nr:VWA domain-containing protein [Myxococcales bacterium]MCB9576820.1 VWA domain-containing protein [Polyangiaceae bacterium]